MISLQAERLARPILIPHGGGGALRRESFIASGKRRPVTDESRIFVCPCTSDFRPSRAVRACAKCGSCLFLLLVARSARTNPRALRSAIRRGCAAPQRRRGTRRIKSAHRPHTALRYFSRRRGTHQPARPPGGPILLRPY